MKFLACMAAMLLTACSDTSPSLPDTSPSLPLGVAGIMHVDGGTDYVFSTAPSQIGGACSGWNTVSIQKPGQGSSGMVNLMCWKEEGGLIHTATEARENPGGQLMSVINR